jgi:hypothetical protein
MAFSLTVGVPICDWGVLYIIAGVFIFSVGVVFPLWVFLFFPVGDFSLCGRFV